MMTREEALKRLKEARNTIQPFRYVDEAIDYAIEALEQEPCDDCVSRQVVKEQMLKYGFHAPDMTVTEFVEDLPPVLPKRKQGEWICDDNQGVQAVGYLTYHCSKCGREICSKYHGKISLLEEYPYCHCGAEMR